MTGWDATLPNPSLRREGFPGCVVPGAGGDLEGKAQGLGDAGGGLGGGRRPSLELLEGQAVEGQLALVAAIDEDRREDVIGEAELRQIDADLVVGDLG